MLTIRISINNSPKGKIVIYRIKESIDLRVNCKDGKPLGSKNNKKLTGILKIKVGDVRVIYTYYEVKSLMYVIVIAAPAHDKVYRIAYDR